MYNFWTGMAVGIFIGVWFGFFLCALLVSAKRADRKMEDMTRYTAAEKDAEEVNRRFLSFRVN